MAITAVAEPPVAIRIRFSAITLLRSLHRTSIFVAYASPLPSDLADVQRSTALAGKVADLVS